MTATPTPEDFPARRQPGRVPWRVWTALALLAAGTLCPGCGCDTEWKARADDAFKYGIQAERDRNYDKARKRYKLALKENPYHLRANLQMGELYELYLFRERHANALALRYYRRFIDLGPKDRREAAVVRGQIDILDDIVQGRLEDPAYAVVDLLRAVEKKSLPDFSERLSAVIVAQLGREDMTPEQYLALWRERIVGRTYEQEFREIFKERDGFGAEIRVAFLKDKTVVERRALRFVLSGPGLWELLSDKKLSDLAPEMAAGKSVPPS